jgi:hypothetical protein
LGINVNAFAEALVCAIQHIEARPSNDEDSDVAALVSTGTTLQFASAEEKAVLGLEAKNWAIPSCLGVWAFNLPA